jgi:hypothetical protein
MAKLIIARTSEYNSRFRDYEIYIDERRVATIGNGQTKEINIDSGEHTLFAKIDWAASKRLNFKVELNETKTFKVGGFKNGKWIMPLTLGIIVLSYILKITAGINYLFYLAIPPFLILVYYLTLGRKNYLTLKEI